MWMSKCDQCNDPAITKIAFVGSNSSSTKICDKHRDEIFDQYKKMGKPGQIIITKE
jgi:hypothetical protein